ncbi:hypothetical protein J2Z83_000752 [Virgibacillus natechei]|uniref:DUF4352 domain-containing protein n=1 Tax=Virgibacillus natechei TaxID=1216297 RepID=A0ABS4IDE1_9BACI|nr:DUF4352 domain-containing protein [Virgibacillus natechei]MBP1968660.1 hypothetical protein [Virgibacillus natechei]UZD13764.1 DUF4352 domain-containing protein [Virgibacillus natechei]
MKHFIKLSLSLMLSLSIIAGCSDQENEEGQTGDQQVNEENELAEEESNSQETGAIEEEESEEEENTNDSSESNDTHVEHQEGLKMGETGIVVDNSENRYEVTLNSIEYVDEVGGSEAIGDTHAVVDITVKNIGEESFNAKDIYEPSFGPIEGEEGLQATLNPIFIDEPGMVEQDLLEGEVAPGESVTGVHIYDIEKVEEYLFIIGGKGHQIRTYAQWEVSDSEIE